MDDTRQFDAARRTLRAVIARLLLGLLVMPLLTGCTLWLDTPDPEKELSLLRPATPSPSSVAIEIFSARFPYGDAELNDALWHHVDELKLPHALRQELARSGIRAGVLGSSPPPQLVRLLNLRDEPVHSDPLQQDVNVETEPMVKKQLMHLRNGRHGKYVLSQILPELSFLLHDGGQVRGMSLSKAQTVLDVSVQVEADGQARLVLLPEIHHGDPQRQYTFEDGIGRLSMARPIESFAKLRLETQLSPGQMLLVTSLPDRPGSLGHHFFTEPGEAHQQQKMIVIRLAQTPDDALFSEDELPPLAAADN
ncbi:MAG: hypothetical protein WDZ59_14950 [Pirellulales bacterium]